MENNAPEQVQALVSQTPVKPTKPTKWTDDSQNITYFALGPQGEKIISVIRQHKFTVGGTDTTQYHLATIKQEELPMAVWAFTNPALTGVTRTSQENIDGDEKFWIKNYKKKAIIDLNSLPPPPLVVQLTKGTDDTTVEREQAIYDDDGPETGPASKNYIKVMNESYGLSSPSAQEIQAQDGFSAGLQQAQDDPSEAVRQAAARQAAAAAQQAARKQRQAADVQDTGPKTVAEAVRQAAGPKTPQKTAAASTDDSDDDEEPAKVSERQAAQQAARKQRQAADVQDTGPKTAAEGGRRRRTRKGRRGKKARKTRKGKKARKTRKGKKRSGRRKSKRR